MNPNEKPTVHQRGDPAHLLDLGNRQAQEGRLEQAIFLYRRALTLKPDFAAAHNNLGILLSLQGRLDEAAACFRQAQVCEPEGADPHLNLGNLLLQQGRLDQAAEQYRLALALQPGHADTHQNLGVTRFRQGRIEEAVACYHQALALDAGNANAHMNLGVALYGQERWDEAEACYQRALAIKPDHADALMNLGVALIRQERLEEAVARFQQALAIDPGNPRTHMNLGVARFRQRRLEEAAASYRQAIALKPDDADIHYKLGVVLLEQDRLDEAEQQYRLALALQPQDAQTLNNLGVTLYRMGRLAEAATCYDEALARKPDHVEAHYNRCEVKTFRAGDPDLAALEALAVDAERLPAGQAAYLHFALGKALDDVGELPRAFHHLSTGNALRRSQLHYDETAIHNEFLRVRAVFEPGLFERLSGMGDPSDRPVFVLGMPRSGSTLVEQILASHPQVHAAGELTGLAAVARSGLGADQPLTPFPEYLPELDGQALARLGRAYLDRLPPLPAGQTRVTDKMPNNFLFVGLIHLILPNAKIIHSRRDPLDTCVSCFSKLFTEFQDFSFDLGELGRYYLWYHQLMAHWRSLLPAGTLLELSYEELVDDLESGARRLIAFCGLPWDQRCLNFHQTQRPILTASARQVRQPLFRSSIGRGTRYRPFLKPLLDELAPLHASRDESPLEPLPDRAYALKLPE